MLLYTCSDAKRHLRPAIAFPHSQRYRTVQLCSCAAAQGQLTRHGAGLFDHGPVEAYVLHTHRIPMSCTYTLISPAISYYQYNISVISYAAIKHAVILSSAYIACIRSECSGSFALKSDLQFSSRTGDHATDCPDSANFPFEVKVSVAGLRHLQLSSRHSSVNNIIHAKSLSDCDRYTQHVFYSFSCFAC